MIKLKVRPLLRCAAALVCFVLLQSVYRFFKDLSDSKRLAITRNAPRQATIHVESGAVNLRKAFRSQNTVDDESTSNPVEFEVGDDRFYYEDAEDNNFQGEEIGNGSLILSERDFLRMINQRNGGATKLPGRDEPDFDKLLIKINGPDLILNLKEYKRYKAREFIALNANPAEKSGQPPTLKPYPDNMERPLPLLLVHDTTMFVDRKAVEKEWVDEKARRLAMGDDDLLKLPEVLRALSKSRGTPVPNIVHFIWFGSRRYRVHHYISMLSALKMQNPDLILLHTDCEPTGSYWDSFRDFAQNVLKIVKRSPTKTVWGKNVEQVEHQSDIARLQILLEVGGIYMDDDVVVLRSLDELRQSEMVLGEENYDALANSIIMAEKDSWFLNRWYQEYKAFNDSVWSESSCFVPWCLWRLFPDTIRVVKEKMLRPNWEEIKFLYHELWNWKRSYTVHLYSRFMPAIDGRKERTLKELAILNTTYGEIARYVIWDHEKPRDLTEWILQ